MKGTFKLMISIFMAFIIPVLNLDTFSSNAAKNNIDYTLWDKFLKYDLCITDYDSLTEEEKELCHFIFETEQGTDETIICERARRALAHDENLGERITLDQLEDAYGIWDNYSPFKYGKQGYIHCVPDIKHIDAKNSCNEYWLDDNGSVKVMFTGENSGLWSSFKVYENDNYEVKVKTLTAADYIEQDGDLFFITPDNTAVLVSSRYKAKSYDEKLEPINETVYVSETVNNFPVTAIGKDAFMYAPVTKVTLPDSIKFIDESAFSCCSNLSEINFPNELEYIGLYAFTGCGFTDIQIDCPELTISNRAFRGLNITDAEINAQEIGENSFSYCVNLKNLTFGEDVKKIDANAFNSCQAIENLTLPSSITAIGAGAFAGDKFSYSGIKSIIIPASIEIIGALPRQRGVAATSGIDIPASHPLTDEPECVFDSDCVINGWYGTEAHSYALSNNLKFNPMDELFYGDANNDGEIGIADAVALQKYLLRNETVGYEADLNKDGRIDSFDMIAMRKMLIEN